MTAVWVSLAFFAFGAVVGRWVAVALPVVGWPLHAAGVAAGWWGSGFGDGWAYAVVWATAMSAAATLAGVVARKLVSGWWRRRYAGTASSSL